MVIWLYFHKKRPQSCFCKQLRNTRCCTPRNHLIFNYFVAASHNFWITPCTVHAVIKSDTSYLLIFSIQYFWYIIKVVSNGKRCIKVIKFSNLKTTCGVFICINVHNIHEYTINWRSWSDFVTAQYKITCTSN